MTKEQRLWKELQAKRQEAETKLQKIIAPALRVRDAELDVANAVYEPAVAAARSKFEAATANARQDCADEIRPFEQAWAAEYQKTRNNR